MTRKTVERAAIVATANRMIGHLAQDGTKSSTDKREAIIVLTKDLLLDAGAYRGFSYLQPPAITSDGRKVYDDSRIAFN